MSGHYVYPPRRNIDKRLDPPPPPPDKVISPLEFGRRVHKPIGSLLKPETGQQRDIPSRPDETVRASCLRASWHWWVSAVRSYKSPTCCWWVCLKVWAVIHCIYRIAMRALTIQCSATNSHEKHCLKTSNHAWLSGATLAVSQATNCDTLLFSFTTSMFLHTLVPVHRSRVHARVRIESGRRD